jgi:fumarate reductase subunit C
VTSSSASGLDAGADAGAVRSADLRREALFWYAQRVSAMVLALCVVVHLAIIVYAVRGGLSAAEILGRTRGSWAFGAFYATFVVACAIHAPIGLANVLAETWRRHVRAGAVVAQLFAALLLALGLVAVYAVVRR